MTKKIILGKGKYDKAWRDHTGDMLLMTLIREIENIRKKAFADGFESAKRSFPTRNA